MHVRSIVNNIRELNWLKTRSVLLGVKLNNRSKKRLRTFSNANSAKLSPEASGSGSRPSCGRLSLGLGRLGMKGLGLVSELRVSVLAVSGSYAACTSLAFSTATALL